MALIKCPDCGRDISDKAIACIGCGRVMKSNIQSEIIQPNTVEKPVYEQINQQNNYPYTGSQYYSELDTPSTGLNVISFLIPLVGLIIYITENNRSPQKAQAAGKWALIGFIIGLIITAVSYGVLLSL